MVVESFCRIDGGFLGRYHFFLFRFLAGGGRDWLVSSVSGRLRVICGPLTNFFFFLRWRPSRTIETFSRLFLSERNDSPAKIGGSVSDISS